MRFIHCFLVFCLIIVGVCPAPSAAAGDKVSAKSVLFSNSTKTIRYYGKNVHKRVRPASTVKVMTALLVLEHLPLNRVVTVSQRATLPQPSKIYVKTGERYTVRELLYALLISSANDAAVVLAEAVAGSEHRFVQMMNRRARQLGTRNTKFINANGLPQGKQSSYSSAYDMYLIFRTAIKYSFFRRAIQRKYQTIYSQNGRKIALRSHNQSLFKGWKHSVHGKTGWTRRAGQCFVGYIIRGRDVCIISIFGATRRWDDVKYIISKYGGISL